MRLLRTTTHPDVPQHNRRIFHRQATRAIVLEGENILMLYTKRYNDYTLPGGGIDDGEDMIKALSRELKEETGAHSVSDIQPFGCYEEFRPWYKDNLNVMHMNSFCFTCKIGAELGDTAFEDYEIHNGMRPVWINIFDAIAHNEHTMAHSDKQGLSIERETFLLKLITQQLLPSS